MPLSLWPQKRRLAELWNDTHLWAAVFISFLMVFIKKWEPGGNLDTIWYSAIAKNVAETGDYFHFFISRHYLNHVFDHMPLSYWVIGTLMKYLGTTDLVARLYPMICSFFSYMIVYKIGCFLKDKDYGIVTLLTYVACFGASKWNGAVMHDVPLTTYLLATFYFFLLAKDDSKKYYGMAPFFALGIWTKGPIVFGFPLGLILWSLWEYDFYYFKQKDFYLSFLLLLGLLAIPFLPALSFDGVSVYHRFYTEKVGYLAPAGQRKNHFDYFALILQTSTITILPFFMTFWLILKKKTLLSKESVSLLKLVFFVAAAIIIPLSMFKIKFPHYLLPFYPFFSIFAAPPIYILYKSLQKWRSFNFPNLLIKLSTLTVCAFVALPIKTTGKRTKAEVNLVNLIKLDKDIKKKDIYFYGVYEDNMIIFQLFKFYGSIDLRSIQGDEILNVDLNRSYVIINTSKLPLKVGRLNISPDNCYMKNETLCVIANPQSTQYIFPDKYFPHEIY